MFRTTSPLIDSNLTGIRQLADMIKTNVNKAIEITRQCGEDMVVPLKQLLLNYDFHCDPQHHFMRAQVHSLKLGCQKYKQKSNKIMQNP